MQKDFWQKKWESQKIGFDQDVPNALLIKHLSALNLDNNSRIFVPLCGKSIDMLWLAKQGYTVTGCELVETAVQAFFDDNNIEVTINELADRELKVYQGVVAGQSITIWAGDIFKLTPTDIGVIDAVYDRAALVALPDEGEDSLRKRYVQQLIVLTDTAPQLLLNFTVNEAVLDESRSFDRKTFGPPFVVEADAIRAYYQDVYHIDHIATDTPNATHVLVNQAWRLLPRN